MQLRQCFASAKPFRQKKSQILSGFLRFPKKPKALKKGRISKYGFKKAELATLTGIHKFCKLMC